MPCQAANTKHFLINLNDKLNGKLIHEFIITILSLSSSIEMSKLPNSLSDPAKNSQIRMSIKVFSHFNQIFKQKLTNDNFIVSLTVSYAFKSEIL